MKLELRENLLTKYSFIAKKAIDAVGDGWFNLIDYCLLRIKEYPAPDSFEITQIKEKFGGLRIYYRIHDSTFFYMMEGESLQDTNKKCAFRWAIDKYIAEAEADSYHVCEVCGKPATLDKSQFWIKTLCEEHKAERAK